MSEIQIVGHVDATFGGKPVRFELYRDRETVAKLEALVGSANAAWGRFLVATWTVSDVRAVLALAHPAVATAHGSSLYHGLNRAESISHTADRLSGRVPPAGAVPPRLDKGVEPEVIDRVMSRRPIATYAPLAEKILQAFMIGMPAATATFDERTALDAARAAQNVPEERGEAAA